MTQHPITPPPELVNLWMSEDAPWDSDSFGVFTVRPSQLRHIATQAARWGADAELEACCEWLDSEKILCKDGGYIRKLCAARRPKPPSLKELALARTDAILNDPNRALLIEVRETLELNRRALEQLDD